MENAFDLVRAEWGQMCAQPGTVERVHSWLVESGVPVDVDATEGLDGLLRALKRGSVPSDRWLAVLVKRAAAGCELAALVVVVAMVPAALRSVKQLRLRYEVPVDEVAQVVAASLYEMVRRYPLARRPEKIALNIAWDTSKRAARELQSELPSSDLEWIEEYVGSLVDEEDPVRLAEQAQLAEDVVTAGLGELGDLEGARAEMAELLVWALREQVLERAGVETLVTFYREGAPADAVMARQVGVSAAVLRKRRSRAVQQLRAAVPRWRLAQAA
ncbi:hypothetical protein [Streptomyces alkaliterrae]|uniref:Sigma-70 family RNA polymerase sigma factor n=1 Tax=Streptomyces alkaliterrae TaxID=2213162 RepID=A0A5P0YP83_9ACTN|nr:hypothetical protein [Streptomyces alkaliterrae]MBB1260166.1 hypothetical protein [Streptomyces alkaliterrae]MQS02091.1 hypothetical protein [Streptomyces alkaliterrae]